MTPISIEDVKKRLSGCKNAGMDLESTIKYFDSGMEKSPKEFAESELSESELSVSDYEKIMGKQPDTHGVVDLNVPV